MIRPSLILIGLLLGLALGIVYGWLISPVQYTDTAPAALRRDYKDQYLILIAQAYAAGGDLERARQRIASLGDADAGEAVTALAQQLAAQRKDSSALSALAYALGVRIPAATSGSTPTLARNATHTPLPSITPTLPPSATPFPTLTPTATPAYDYELILREDYCNDAERAPLIIVDVVDADSAPLPGVKVIVKWAEGEDGFVTGLKPEISSSYGDFLMNVGTTYSVQIGSRTLPVTGLAAPTCVAADDGKPYAGAVRLVFQRK